jgi:hypothetical protein
MTHILLAPGENWLDRTGENLINSSVIVKPRSYRLELSSTEG